MIVMRLIDADNVRNLFDAEFKETRKLILAGETHLDNLAEGFAEADRVIWQMPTVDAVPVVRCKDCKYYRVSAMLAPNKFCFRLKHPVEGRPIGYNFAPDDFCSYGERRDDDDDAKEN